MIPTIKPIITPEIKFPAIPATLAVKMVARPNSGVFIGWLKSTKLFAKDVSYPKKAAQRDCRKTFAGKNLPQWARKTVKILLEG